MNHWDRHDAADQDAFLSLLTPLVAAAGARAREWRDEASARTQLLVWMIAFADVPRDIFAAAVERKIQRGVGWMPSHEEVRNLCCDVVDERRAVFAARARKLQDDCTVCRDSRGWKADEDGRMMPCDCKAAARAVMAQALAPLERPALPAAQEAM